MARVVLAATLRPRSPSAARAACSARSRMNVHHLELFYYVAKHGGIMPAVRNIPYGIQQPAVSSQIAHLEEYPGVTVIPAEAGGAARSYDFASFQPETGTVPAEGRSRLNPVFRRVTRGESGRLSR